MPKPTNAIRGFIQLTQQDGLLISISLHNISTVRGSGTTSLVNLANNPFHLAPRELSVREDYEEVMRRISEAA